MCLCHVSQSSIEHEAIIGHFIHSGIYMCARGPNKWCCQVSMRQHSCFYSPLPTTAGLLDCSPPPQWSPPLSLLSEMLHTAATLFPVRERPPSLPVSIHWPLAYSLGPACPQTPPSLVGLPWLSHQIHPALWTSLAISTFLTILTGIRYSCGGPWWKMN